MTSRPSAIAGDATSGAAVSNSHSFSPVARSSWLTACTIYANQTDIWRNSEWYCGMIRKGVSHKGPKNGSSHTSSLLSLTQGPRGIKPSEYTNSKVGRKT